MSTRTYGPRTSGPVAPRANRFGGKCTKCGNWVAAGAGLLTGSKAAGWATEHNALTGCPAPKAPARNAAPGYYVRPADGKAVLVVTSKQHADRTYGKVLNFPADGGRPSWDYTPGAGYTVADLRPMTAADAAAMGLAHNHCIRCCAKLGPADPAKPTLSALVSARIGYGETCARRMGWPFPKGAAAQRAFLAG
jgi:hypothetical protein